MKDLDKIQQTLNLYELRELHTARQEVREPIKQDDITNLAIDLNMTNTIEEFLTLLGA